jgi:hypothetical protein
MPDRRTLGTPLDAVSAPGRTMIGMVAGFISERWPEKDRNRGRLQLGIPGRMKSESAPTPPARVGHTFFPATRFISRAAAVTSCASSISSAASYLAAHRS